MGKYGATYVGFGYRSSILPATENMSDKEGKGGAERDKAR